MNASFCALNHHAFLRRFIAPRGACLATSECGLAAARVAMCWCQPSANDASVPSAISHGYWGITLAGAWVRRKREICAVSVGADGSMAIGQAGETVGGSKASNRVLMAMDNLRALYHPGRFFHPGFRGDLGAALVARVWGAPGPVLNKPQLHGGVTHYDGGGSGHVGSLRR